MKYRQKTQAIEAVKFQDAFDWALHRKPGIPEWLSEALQYCILIDMNDTALHVYEDEHDIITSTAQAGDWIVYRATCDGSHEVVAIRRDVFDATYEEVVE